MERSDVVFSTSLSTGDNAVCKSDMFELVSSRDANLHADILDRTQRQR
jgi:hypothetical protein